MCRAIKPLFNFEPPATPDEVHAAALQFVRKISGFAKPAAVNQAAFDAAVLEISATAQHLLATLETKAPPRDRDIEALKAKARFARRDARR